MLAAAGLARGAIDLERPLESAMVRLGLGIDQVELAGNKFTADSELYRAIDLSATRSMLHLDTRAVRERIEQLPWIAKADVRRVLPNRVQIIVEERQAYAVWRNGGANYLIDETGHVLAAIGSRRLAHLPLVAGPGAAEAAKALHVVLADFADLAARVAAGERVGERRWTLHLADGSAINLPATGQRRALERLFANLELSKLLADGPKRIDLRAPSRVSVRPQTVSSGRRR